MPNTISLAVQGGATINNIPWTNGMNVQQVMEAAYNTFVNPPMLPRLSYWVEYFGASLGYFVSMLDGTTQMGNKYWMLYVNDVLATGGIDATIVNDGDAVSFKYQAYSPGLHGHTLMAQVHALKTK